MMAQGIGPPDSGVGTTIIILQRVRGPGGSPTGFPTAAHVPSFGALSTMLPRGPSSLAAGLLLASCWPLAGLLLASRWRLACLLLAVLASWLFAGFKLPHEDFSRKSVFQKGRKTSEFSSGKCLFFNGFGVSCLTAEADLLLPVTSS